MSYLPMEGLMTNQVRPYVYCAVIALAFTLPEPWMVGVQAALGGIALGTWCERYRATRT